MLHSLQKPFPPPTHCLKHLYKFYLNRKLEILFTICFSPKTASKINAQTLQEDINLTLTFFFYFFKKKETAKLSLPNSTNKYGIEQKPIWKGSSVAQSVDPKNKLGFQNFLVFKLIYSIAWGIEFILVSQNPHEAPCLISWNVDSS